MNLEVIVSGVLLPFFVYYFCFSIKSWIFDLKFYRANGWDFTKNSGVKMYPGSFVRIKGMAPIPNSQRVIVGFPVFIVAMLTAVVGFTAIVLEALNG